MLKLFRSNSLFLILLLIVYAGILKTAFFLFPQDIVIDFKEPLGRFFEYLLTSAHLTGHFWSVSLAFIFIILQALLLNFVVNRHKLLEEQTLLPALSYILVSSLFYEFNIFSPPLLAAFFISWSADRILGIHKMEKADMEIFDAGLLIAVASLFYLPSALLLIWLFISLSIQRAFNPREWIVALVGFLVPFFLAFTYFFWMDSLDYFLQEYLLINWSVIVIDISFDSFFYTKIGALLIVSIWFLMNMLQVTSTGNIQIRKYNTIIISLFLLIIGAIALQPEITLTHFYLTLIPLAVIFAYSFILPGQIEIMEIPHLLIILTILITQYFNFAVIKNLF